jgi:hypothetical protein
MTGSPIIVQRMSAVTLSITYAVSPLAKASLIRFRNVSIVDVIVMTPACPV